MTKLTDHIFHLKPANLGAFRDEIAELAWSLRDRPWADIFRVEAIPCTSETASFYNASLTGGTTQGTCPLPADRGGVFSLASFLKSNSSSFLEHSNNYNRAAKVVYAITGTELAGDAPRDIGLDVDPLAFPPSFLRPHQRLDNADRPMGTYSIPAAGQYCASCHKSHLGPLSVAFRQFGLQGELLAINRLTGPYMENYEEIFQEVRSCWSLQPDEPPQEFVGIRELGELLAKTSQLGVALSHQIPRTFGVDKPSPRVQDEIKAAFAKEPTLLAALQGFLESQTQSCPKAELTFVTEAEVDAPEFDCTTGGAAVWQANLQGPIERSCANCHNSAVPSLILQSDDSDGNRQRLLAKIDPQRLWGKISSAQNHGGGDQSEVLPQMAVKALVKAEAKCRN